MMGGISVGRNHSFISRSASWGFAEAWSDYPILSDKFSFFIIQRNYGSSARMQPGLCCLASCGLVLPQISRIFLMAFGPDTISLWLCVSRDHPDNADNRVCIAEATDKKTFLYAQHNVLLPLRDLQKQPSAPRNAGPCGIQKIAKVYILLMNFWEHQVLWV